MKKIMGLFLSVAIIISCLMPPCNALAEGEASNDLGNSASVGDNNSFFNYYTKYSEKSMAQEIYNIQASDFQGELIDMEGRKTLALKEGSSAKCTLNVKASGIYPVAFTYFNTDESDSNYIVSLKVNGAFPYEEANNLVISRLWRDDIENEFKKDEYGNDIRPSQVNVKAWTQSYIYDSRGFYNLPYFIYLEEGKNNIELTAVSNNLFFSEFVLGMSLPSVSYKEYSKSAKESGTEKVLLQAENMYLKSNSVLYPTYDKTNSATSPQSAKCILLNTVGKSTWNKNGDFISWKPNIKKAGWYYISLRVRQNENQSMNSYRTLKINGKIPFKEAENIAFEYNSDWYIKTLGDKSPYLFYLKPDDEISLSVASGSNCELLRLINYHSLRLTEIYRDVISITSSTPDSYRDYMLSDQLPDLEQELKDEVEALSKVSDSFVKITGTKGSQVSILDYISKILNEFAYDCNDIPNRLSAFQSVLENLGSLQTTIGKQPLEIDRFIFSSKQDLPNANNNWFKQTLFSLKAFVASFSLDYNSSADASSVNTINVWATVGRDQAKIISNLIRDNYNSSSKTKVKLSIVGAQDVLIKASLAGKGPDVALLAGVPLELAARGALVPLTDYDFGSLKDEFIPEIWNAMSYNGKIYALPETLAFHTMFYRKDVLEEYNIAVPETWDDFYKVMEELQKNNLTVGIPEIDTANYGVSHGISIFSMFLMQNGGKYYNKKLTKNAFDSQAAFDAFQKWVDIYKLYGNSRDFNFYSRFRTGEMPISIQLYSAYNQVASAAPEIDGLWDFAEIPATVKEDGSLSRAQVGTATGCYMLKSAVKKGIDKEAFEFMKWWASGDTQTKYGRELEATMGVAGRYTPANKKALNNLGWSTKEKEILNKSLEEVVLVEQVPGNYLLQRSLTTAFRSAVTGKSRAKRALTIANKEINDELARKRQEFNLD